MPFFPDHDTIGIASSLTFASQRDRDELSVILPEWSLWIQAVRKHHCRGINYHLLYRHRSLFGIISCYTNSSCYSSWISIFLECCQCLPVRIAKLFGLSDYLKPTVCMQYGAVIFAQMRYTRSWFTMMFTSFAICFGLFFFQMYLIFFQPNVLYIFALFCRLGTNLRTRPSQETNLSKFFYQLHQLVNYVVR